MFGLSSMLGLISPAQVRGMLIGALPNVNREIRKRLLAHFGLPDDATTANIQYSMIHTGKGDAFVLFEVGDQYPQLGEVKHLVPVATMIQSLPDDDIQAMVDKLAKDAGA